MDPPERGRRSSGRRADLSVLLTAIGPGRERILDFSTTRSVGHELEMAKAALLYADHVTIVSPVVGRVALMAAASAAAKRGDDEAAAGFIRRLEHSRGPTVDLANATLVHHHALELGETVHQTLSTDPTWRELMACFGKGLVKIEPFPGGPAVEALGELLHILQHGRGAMPGWLTMADYRAGDIIQAVAEFPEVRGRIAARSLREMAIVAHVVDRMPAFPHATMTEILDVRERLAPALTRFRSKVTEFAQSLTSSPASPDFDREVDELYRREVAPRLLEVQELGRESRFWTALTREVAENSGGRLLSATASVFVTAGLGLPAALQAGVAAATAAVDAVGKARGRQREESDKLSHHELYWVYTADRVLSSIA